MILPNHSILQYPQVPLAPRVQQESLQELPSPDLLRTSLDVMEIVLGFLSSSGGKPKSRLVGYLKRLKMDEKHFSAKVFLSNLSVGQL